MSSLEDRIKRLEVRLDVAQSILALERLKADCAAGVDERHEYLQAGATDPVWLKKTATRVAALFTQDAVWKPTPTSVSMASGCIHPCRWKQ